VQSGSPSRSSAPPVNTNSPGPTVTATAPPGGGVTATATSNPNPAPQQLAVAAFIIREIVALFFVLGWLAVTGIDWLHYPDEQLVPFWFHLLGAGVLAYALGVNVATLVPTSGLTITANPR
jgi:hypothetical protein